jgi:acetyltransferase
MGVGRMNKLHTRNEAEVAALVSDRYQRRGLGYELLRRVVQVARDEKIALVSAEMLPDNIAMRAVFKRLGFHIHMDEDLTSLQATLDL